MLVAPSIKAYNNAVFIHRFLVYKDSFMHSSAFSPHNFIQLALDNNVLKFGEFILKSGRISPYFFYAGLLASGEMLSLLARG